MKMNGSTPLSSHPATTGIRRQHLFSGDLSFPIARNNGNGTHHHPRVNLSQCSGNYCVNESVVAKQADEISRLKKMVANVSRERDTLICEIEHLKMEILAGELGRLGSQSIDSASNACINDEEEDFPEDDHHCNRRDAHGDISSGLYRRTSSVQQYEEANVSIGITDLVGHSVDSDTSKLR